MTKIQLIRLLVGQARANGFEFRKWYTSKLGRPWIDAKTSIEDLAAERRYYVLLFSHEFASNFWKSGETITFQVPKQTFQRKMADGTIGTVRRKPYIRRSAREDVWRYHLQELAVADEPLRYMRRYLMVEEDLDGEQQTEHPQTDKLGPRNPQAGKPASADAFTQRSTKSSHRAEPIKKSVFDGNVAHGS